PEPSLEGAGALRADDDGYLQIIDSEALIRLAQENDLILRVEKRPGQYVARGSKLVTVWPGERFEDSLVEELNWAFALGSQRTSVQDLEFTIGQLVEVAVRSLSPGINDPFTAIACIDRLSSAMVRIASRDLPSPFHYDDSGQLRLIRHSADFPELLDAAFDPIRHYGQSSPAVVLRLMEALATIAELVERPEDREALRRHAETLSRGANRDIPENADRQAIDQCHRTLLEDLER
ncbi:MAG: DUF2254 domain-containing protein, partial [Thermoanaerobaculia bacterium]|nr:DUF2254 domain-containing protein [Thermoanaerobaculia bacterium]